MNIRNIVLALFFIPASTLAGSETGTVDYLTVRASDGLVYFNVVGEKSDSPACATKDYWIIKDETSDAGKMQYSMLLAAAASGTPVVIKGAGACSRWGDGESVNEVQFSP